MPVKWQEVDYRKISQVFFADKLRARMEANSQSEPPDPPGSEPKTIMLSGGKMNITEVRIFPKNEEKLKAYAAITFDDCFVVHNLRIVQGERGLMVCMPSRKKTDGTFKDVAHPINSDFRRGLESKVLDAYEMKLKEMPQEA